MSRGELEAFDQAVFEKFGHMLQPLQRRTWEDFTKPVRAAEFPQYETDPMAEALNDPEGRALVQAIHDRKAATT